MIICIFGASIVWGAVDPEHSGWVGRLRSFLELKRNFEIDVYNLGVSGDTTTDLLERFEVECKAREPNIILISIGINDAQYINNESNPRTSLKDFRNNIQKVIKIAQRFTPQIIFVGFNPIDESKTMPIPWSPEKYYTNENVKKYNDMVKLVNKENNLLFIEIFEEWMKVDYRNLLEDGLHPNSKGHQKIFETVKDFLIKNEITKI